MRRFESINLYLKISGNLAWALQRGNSEDGLKEDMKMILIEKAAKAIKEDQKRHQVLIVYMNVSSETTVRRRKNPDFITSQLPFDDEVEESNRLHDALGPGVKQMLANCEHLRDLSVPILEVENNEDGTEFIEAAALNILNFIQYFNA